MMQSLNIKASMNFDVTAVLARLKANLAKHKGIVEEARAGYMKSAGAALERRLKELDAGKIVSLSFTLSPPADYSSAYETVIEMLRATDDTIIPLTSSEFRCLMQDEWDWMSTFLHVNKAYSKQAEVEAESKGL